MLVGTWRGTGVHFRYLHRGQAGVRGSVWGVARLRNVLPTLIRRHKLLICTDKSGTGASRCHLRGAITARTCTRQLADSRKPSLKSRISGVASRDTDVPPPLGLRPPLTRSPAVPVAPLQRLPFFLVLHRLSFALHLHPRPYHSQHHSLTPALLPISMSAPTIEFSPSLQWH